MENTWIEISASALKFNAKHFRKLIHHPTRLMAMIKANAYGHGIAQTSSVLSPLVDWFGVNTLAEAQLLRSLNIPNPILITAPITNTEKAVALDVSICAHSLPYLDSISKLPLKIHLKINTGMNRLGTSLAELPTALRIIDASQLQLEGVYTHFHSADSSTQSTLNQFYLFQKAKLQIQHFYPQVIFHCANSSAAINLPQTHLDLVRIGIGLYGLLPNLKPVLSWKARVIQSRILQPPSTVGYSGTFIAKKPTFMAVLPVGYSDGLDRKLSNISPVIGRISMNFTTVQSSRLYTEGQVINVFNSADRIANDLGTINYEVVSRINPLIPRMIVK